MGQLWAKIGANYRLKWEPLSAEMGNWVFFYFFFFFLLNLLLLSNFVLYMQPRELQRQIDVIERQLMDTKQNKEFGMSMLPQGVIAILIAIKSSLILDEHPLFCWITLNACMCFVVCNIIKSSLCFSSLRRSRHKQQLCKKSAPKECNSHWFDKQPGWSP
jgi:hypothetical protein